MDTNNYLLRKVGIYRFFRHIMADIYTKIKEKHFVSDGVTLRYMLFPAQSDVLIIGFQACSDPPRYNYVRRLKDINATRLYIKDDFAADHRGNYYIGENGTYNVEKAVHSLINQVILRSKAGGVKKLIFIGSSKGGYAALNFGIEYDNASIIIGAPQYLLGNYLNCDVMKPQLENILGKITDEGISELNKRLKQKITKRNQAYSQRIYLHYSDQEHTYSEHICYLIDDINRSNIDLVQDVEHYRVHEDVSLYYPQFLLRCVEAVLEDKLRMENSNAYKIS